MLAGREGLDANARDWVDPDEALTLNYHEQQDLLAALARRLAPYFPSDVQSLVDFAGNDDCAAWCA